VIPYVLRSLEQALRAGFSLRQAVARISGDVEGLDDLADRLTRGDELVDSFAEWAGDDPDSRLVVAAVRLQVETGGNLADTFGLLHRLLERR
jgi:Flp pilus assembly protein TadB